jgi:hypothetical protein
MNALAWLVEHRFKSIKRREDDYWVLAFDHDASIRIACLWRLLEEGRVRVTSEDQGHKFCLPTPADAAAEVQSRLAESIVSEVELRDGTLDVRIHFGTDHTFEILPNSSGYEAWEATNATDLFIAVGGGDLTSFRC